MDSSVSTAAAAMACRERESVFGRMRCILHSIEAIASYPASWAYPPDRLTAMSGRTRRVALRGFLPARRVLPVESNQVAREQKGT